MCILSSPTSRLFKKIFHFAKTVCLTSPTGGTRWWRSAQWILNSSLVNLMKPHFNEEQLRGGKGWEKHTNFRRRTKFLRENRPSKPTVTNARDLHDAPPPPPPPPPRYWTMTVTVFIEQKHIQISTNEDSKWKPPSMAAFNPFSCVNLLTGPLIFSSNEKEPGPKEGSLGESLYHEYSNRLDLIRISLLLFFPAAFPSCASLECSWFRLGLFDSSGAGKKKCWPIQIFPLVFIH